MTHRLNPYADMPEVWGDVPNWYHERRRNRMLIRVAAYLALATLAVGVVLWRTW